MFTIDLQSRIPIYEQLYKKIMSLCLKGVLKKGDQLPSVREMAKTLGVNPNTISKAYNELERDGIIYSLAGRGSFVGDIEKEKIVLEKLKIFDEAVDGAFSVGVTGATLKERIDKGEKKND